MNELFVPFTGDGPEGSHPLLPFVDLLLQTLVTACVDTFATIRQLGLHGLAELLSWGLLTDDQVLGGEWLTSLPLVGGDGLYDVMAAVGAV